MLRALARAVLGIGFLLGSTNAASAQPSMAVGIAAGPAVPVGDLADIVRVGYEAGAILAVAPASNFLLRIEATYRVFSGANAGADLRVRGLGASLVYERRQRAAVRPYVVGGVGVSSSRFERPGAQAENDIAASAGGGLAFVRGDTRLFSEVRFHNIFSGANDSNETRRFVPITFGVMRRL